MKAKKRRSGNSGDGSSLAKIEKTANGVKKEVEEDEETEKIHRAIDKTLLKNKTSRATKTEEVTGSNKSSSSIFTPKEIDGMAWKSFQVWPSQRFFFYLLFTIIGILESEQSYPVKYKNFH